jgi:RNA polymerase sigma-70 factor (ECF subfamily)
MRMDPDSRSVARPPGGPADLAAAAQPAAVAPGRIAADDPRIGAAVGGDARALDSLCRVLLPRLRNLARYLLRGDAEVDDAAQEALIAVLRALPGFRGESLLTTWADRIAVRTVLSWARRARGERLKLVAAAELHVNDPAPAPGEEAYRARRLLAALLDALPDDQRQVLVLHHVLGMSMPELSDTLGVPFETARSRLRLAMTRLRQLERTEEAGESDG